MVNEVFASEETVALAKQKACDMLGVSEDQVEFEILQHPSKKMLGMFGGKQAQVKAVLKKSIAQKAVDYLKEILFYMGFSDLSVEVLSENSEECSIKIDGEDLGYIVGKHGETLDSLQYLVSIVANGDKKGKDFCKVRLEAGSYREKRRAVLERLGKNLAIRSVTLKKKVSLEPMKAYERRIIHTAVDTVDGACSWSEGEGEYRHVVVAPMDKEEIMEKEELEELKEIED